MIKNWGKGIGRSRKREIGHGRWSWWRDLSGAGVRSWRSDLGVISKVRLSERREEKGDKFEGMWIGYCRGWVWEKCFTGDVGAMDRRCWRWDGLRRREGGFCLGGSSTCRAQSGRSWGWVREEKKREKTHRRRGVNGSAARRSVGGPRTDVGVWGGALSPSRWCVGWSWRASRTMWSEEFRKCFKGKITPAIVFWVWGVHFTVNGNDFPFDQIFHLQPNTRHGINCFFKSIFSRNKRSLKGWILYFWHFL